MTNAKFLSITIKKPNKVLKITSSLFIFLSFFVISQSLWAKEIKIKLWATADRSGPLRAGNILEAANTLNNMLAAANADERVKIELIETNSKGYDADALQLLKAHSVGKTPDIALAAHEWIGTFVEAGLAANLESHIKTNSTLYEDIIPQLWNSVKFKGDRYGIPQDSEVRMFFLNNDLMRKAGKSESFIASLPSQVNAGQFTMNDLCDLAAEVKNAGAAKYGIIHRPNVGPDFQMAMASFGIDLYNEDQAKLQITKTGLLAYYKWLKRCVDIGAIAGDMTTWSWDSVHAGFRGGEGFSKFHGVWNLGAQLKAFGMSPTDKEAYFKKITWINAPAGKKGGTPSNLSHPIVYIVTNGPHKDLAAILVALASQHVPNTKHAVGTNHTPINYGQAAMPDFVEKGWGLIAGVPLLKYAQFMPNHSKIGQYNAISYQGVQGVETGEMSPEEAVEFVIEEMEVELGDDVIILN
ncbi:MAG TPA: extracellular solute-binding protein [SAR324 cluster bacterium]|jgi:inositol-phosphate transport system substrate-binding protein|nr:sugar ABC transporter substrate-binding protein [Deltaproteobacteria bacterium]MDP6091856.1 extracellular solute-binding protein [SAR324 cluster bacterium]MBI12401.1 sugar ABC transporter substrate-binding protein [Deltaproteobacteria bacterium]MBP43937.1 sugar ABC transporter substrate-binding protein [Deltaproteobacteria bacterium]MDP6463040.1 extracellular solute-binding protein [SAR324 cluster bacterium]|tara:strand:+ start:566 stop:1966 length:1401 start_codon:yes stop_codon:yes gene_type:complete